MRFLRVRERDRLQVGRLPNELSDTDADALAKLSTVLPKGALSWEHKAIRIGPFCGVLRAGNLTLEVLPKIAGEATDPTDARLALIAMLRDAGHLAHIPIGEASLGQQRLHLLDIFILDFCESASRLIRRGVIRSYEIREDNLAAIRGRIDLPKHLRQNLLNRGSIYCRYDEFSADNAHNRALKYVLRQLLGAAFGQEAKSATNALLRRMSDIAAHPCRASDIRRLPFDRLTEHWISIFERAAWFLDGLYPDVIAGTADSACFLFDIQQLFEAFIGAKLRRQWQGGAARLKFQGPQRYLAETRAGAAFRMRPDFTVISARGRIDRIFDAKWKTLDTASPSAGVARDDIYQMAAYAASYGCTLLGLIHPSATPSEHGRVRSFELRIAGEPRLDVYAVDVLLLARGAPLPEGLGPAETNRRPTRHSITSAVAP